MKFHIYAILISIIVFVILSVSLFKIGFHNVDLSHNMALLNKADHKDIYDLKGSTITYRQLYIVGIKQMDFSFYLTAASAFILGMALGFEVKD